MIEKPGKDNKFPQAYRSISLLPAISKVSEIIILPWLKEETGALELLPQEQFGFRGKHGA